MSDRSDREIPIPGARPVERQVQEIRIDLLTSAARCIGRVAEVGARDVGEVNVLLTSDQTCRALYECVSHYARLLGKQGESADRTTELVVTALDLGSAEVHVQDGIRGAVKEWALEAWREATNGKASYELSAPRADQARDTRQ